jgi:hypothetical protein
MYDTINLWLPFEKVKEFNLTKTLNNLSGITEHNKHDGQVYMSGYLNNYKVNLSEQGISLRGSLAKYFLPDNFHTLTRSDTNRAFEKMSDELYLPINKSKVNRIDFAQNLLMDYEPEAYYNFLGECQHYRRQPQSKSLYYSNTLRQIVFYNKVAEGKTKGLSLPPVWDGQNVLRYEMRFTSRLSKQFNQAEIAASSLSDEKFYMIIFNKWLAEYQAINKLNSMESNLSGVHSPKDYFKHLYLTAIRIKGQDKVMQDIESLRHQKAFNKPEYYSRLKKEIKELCKTPEMTSKSDLIAELDKKILTSIKHYR